MAGVFSERSNVKNYGTHGVRAWFSELLDETNLYYDGFVDLGNVVEGPITQDVTFLEHFSAATGTRVQDRKIVSEVKSTLTLTLDEIDVQNMRLLLFGSTITDVTEDLANGSTITDEVMKLSKDERRILEFGIGAGSIVVTGGAALATACVLGVDYTVETYRGYTCIKRVNTSVIITDVNPYVKVDYTYDTRKAKTFNPLTKIEKIGKLKFQGVSKIGQSFEWNIQKASIAPTGDFSLNSEDWTTMQLLVDILDNSTAESLKPFGVVTHLGGDATIN